MVSGWPSVSREDPARAIPSLVMTGSSRRGVPCDIAADGAKLGHQKDLVLALSGKPTESGNNSAQIIMNEAPFDAW